MSKLSNVVKNDVVKKADYNKLVTKVDNIDTSGFVLKTKYDTDKSELEKNIPDTSSLVKKTDYNTKITEIEGIIPGISNLATKTALATVENKVPDISNLATKTALTTVAKLSGRNRKITKNKSKHLLVENESNKLKTFDSGYFCSKNYFDEDGIQNYYIFQPISKYLNVAYVNDINYVLSWKSRGLNDIKIESIKTNNYSLNPRMDLYDMSKINIKLNGSFLNRFPPAILHGDIVNIYIVYEIISNYSSINYPTLENCLFGSVKLTKNADIDKYGYSGYGIGFNKNTSFSVGNEIGKNVIIFGVDMSSSTKIDNRKKDILILGIGPTEGLENTLSAEKMYSINFTKKNTKFCLSLHYNGANSYLFINGTEIIKFKAKDSEILAYSLCLGNISKDWL